MAILKDINTAQILYDALMITTNGDKYAIREICDLLSDELELSRKAHKVADCKVHKNVIHSCDRINFHLIEQGF